mgnify:CR=1 FL=1
MKTRLLVWLGMLACVLVPMAHAVEIMHWERLPLAVPLPQDAAVCYVFGK